MKAKAPVITSTDFSKDPELLPDPSKYEHWHTMLVSITKNEDLGFWKSQSPTEAA